MTGAPVCPSGGSGSPSSSGSQCWAGAAGRSWRRTRTWTSGSTGRPSRWSPRRSGGGRKCCFDARKKHFDVVLVVLLSDILIKMSLPLKTEYPYRSQISHMINWFLIFFWSVHLSDKTLIRLDWISKKSFSCFSTYLNALQHNRLKWNMKIYENKSLLIEIIMSMIA